MPNVNAVLNEQIRRLARREIRASTKTMKKTTGYYRRDIAALKRQVSQVLKQVALLRKLIPNQPEVPPAEVLQKSRLRIDGLKAHRTRLGLSAKDYGSLMGVSSLTIYNWEAGKSKPRRSLLPRIVSVRGIGKREAMQRLGMPEEKSKDATVAKVPATRPRKRGKYKQTGEQAILSLLKNGKSLTTKDVNHAWVREGRGGTADVLLGKLVKARKIKRTKVKGVRGSRYSAA
jgi:DNA-binding transcriptional regulator YiaG